jgi:uncharacterized membrane protein
MQVGQQRWRRALAGAATLASLACTSPAQAGSLTMVDLGMAPGDVASLATGINASGVIIGTGRGEDGAERPWIFQNGTIARAPGMPPDSAFTDINDSGLIVGYLPGDRAITYRNGVRHTLHPALGDNLAVAAGVDDDGTVIGVSGYRPNEGADPTSIRGVEWPAGSSDPVLLDIVPVDQFRSQRPLAISAGRIVGSYGNGIVAEAFALQDGTITPLRKRPGDAYAVAQGVNAKGIAVGYVLNLSEDYLPARWSPSGKLTILPVFSPALPHQLPYGAANAVSPGGLVVGESRRTEGPIHAVAWRGKTLIDLDSFATDSAAYDATTNGRIVGASRVGNPTGFLHAILWTLKGKGS